MGERKFSIVAPHVDEQGGGRDALVLGSAGPALISTGGKWITRARLAFYTKRDQEQAHNRELILILVNMIFDVLGEDVDSTTVHEPAVNLDGLRITIHEYLSSHESGRPPLYRLAVGVKCPFCERETEREFGSLAEIGEIIDQPSGNCIHCSKPLASRPGSAS